jgi:hypothetical protein
MKFELHPLSALFPRMKGKEFEALVSDIKTNGLRNPIVTFDGMILDGGNRYEACLAAGVKPNMTEYKGDNIVTYVMSANFHRRHLSTGQQAAIVASATDWAKAQTVGRPGNAEALPHLSTVSERAKVSGATERTQRDADKLMRENPKAAAQVAKGEKSLYQAVKESKPAPEPVQPTTVQQDSEYTELDAAYDQIQELQDALVVANLGDVSEDDKTQAATLIAELRREIKMLMSNLKAVTTSRDLLMNELAMVKRQCISQQTKLKRLKEV